VSLCLCAFHHIVTTVLWERTVAAMAMVKFSNFAFMTLAQIVATVATDTIVAFVISLVAR
jgi:hypothetical protein